MGLFGDKKKTNENLHVLSEREIQDKLYGRLLFTHDEIGGETIEDSKTKVAPAPTISTPIVPEDTVTKELFQDHEPLPQGEPKIKVTQTDIFRTVRGKPVANAGESSVKLTMSPSLNSLSQPKPKVKTPRDFRMALGLVTAGLGWIGLMVVRGVAFLIRFFTVALDFRKPAVRRFAVLFGGIALIFAVFGGIHSMNLNREIAMKSPRKVKPTVSVATPLSVVAINSSMTKKSESKKEAAQKSKASRKEIVDAVPLKVTTPPVSTATSTQGESVVRATSEIADTPYSIQVATFVGNIDADRLASNLKREGVEAFVKQSHSRGDKTFYAVFVGRFRDYRDAQKYLDVFKKKTIAESFQDAFVKTLE